MPRAFFVRALVLFATLAAVASCGSSSPVAPDQSTIAFQKIDVTVGTGPTAVTGSTANVTYAAWLYSETGTDHKGTQVDPGGTFSFVIGANQVIPGFDQGVTGMQVGGFRRLIIPPSLAYGAQGNGPIPPNSAMVFDVQLNSVQ